MHCESLDCQMAVLFVGFSVFAMLLKDDSLFARRALRQAGVHRGFTHSAKLR